MMPLIATEPMPSASVSVVVPCWNAEKWIARAVQSALDQRGISLDVIVIDDASTDNSAGVLSSFGDKIFFETTPKRGACSARNLGLEICRSKYVLFLDADDYWEGDFLAAQVEAATTVSADLCLGFGVCEFPDGTRLLKSPPPTGEDVPAVLQRILGRDWVPQHAILWRVEFLRKVGGWSTEMLRNQDGELLSRALLALPRLARGEVGRAVYVQHDDCSRVSRRRSPETFACIIGHLEALVPAVVIRGWQSVVPSIGEAAYRLAANCFYFDCPIEGRRALSLARACGIAGHRGSTRHRVLSRVLGLEAKERLSKVFHQRGRRLGRSQRD